MRLKTSSIITFFAFMYILMVYLPLAQNYTKFGLGDVRYWGIGVLLSILIFSPSVYGNKLFLYSLIYWIIFYLLTLTLWENLDDWNLRVAREEIFRFLVPIALFIYYFNYGSKKSFILLMRWGIIFIILTSVLTIYSSTVDPLYVRTMTAGAYTDTQLKQIKSFGGGGYSFASALLFLIPFLVYGFKNATGSKYRIIWFVFLVITIATIVSAQLFANIIIAIFVILLSFGGMKNLKLSIAFIVILLTTFILIPQSIYSDFTIWIASRISPESNIYLKLMDLSLYLDSPYALGTGVMIRYDRFPMLFEAFINSPLLGQFFTSNHNNLVEGGHLYWMNKLAVFGIVNFTFFLMIFSKYFRTIYRNIEQEIAFFFSISVIAGLGYGLFKAIAGWDFWCTFFFILPGFYFTPALLSTSNKSELV